MKSQEGKTFIKDLCILKDIIDNIWPKPDPVRLKRWALISKDSTLISMVSSEITTTTESGKTLTRESCLKISLK